jgi:hypothetical protein
MKTRLNSGQRVLSGVDPAASHTRKKVIIAAMCNYHTCNWHNRALIRLVRDSILLAPLESARMPANQNRFSIGHFSNSDDPPSVSDILSGEFARSHVQAQGADKGCLSNISLARKEPIPAASPTKKRGRAASGVMAKARECNQAGILASRGERACFFKKPGQSPPCGAGRIKECIFPWSTRQ